MRKTTRTALLGATAAVALGGAAQAETLRYAIGWPPNTVATDAIQTYADVAAEASGGELEVKVFPLSLLNFLEASAGVRDGIADIVTILVPYFLSEFPTTNFAGELSGLVDLEEGVGERANMAFTGAFSEFVMLNCEDCAEEFAAQNQVFTAGATSPSYILQCTKPITTAEDLQGARLRAGGAFWARWAEEMGATTISMSINETFEGLSQGVLDCTMSSGSELSQFGFIDVVSDLTTGVPGAVYASATSSVNRGTWQGLTDEERTAIMRASSALSAHMTWNYWDESQKNFEAARAKGITFHEPADALLEESHAYILRDAEARIADYAERFGLQEGDAKLATMRELINKWVPLVQDVETVDALTELYWTEVMSKVDVSAYGM